MRTILRISIIVAALLVGACASMQQGPSPEAKQALAPTGKLRVGLFLGTATMALKDAASGELKGVGYDLGREMAARLGVPYEPVLFPVIPALFDAVRKGEVDVTFLGVNAERAKDVDYSRPYMEIDFGYLAPAGSSLANAAAVDRSGVRLVVVDKGSPDVFFTKSIKSATIVRAPTLPPALEMIKAGKADVFGGLKGNLVDVSARQPGWRVLDGRPGAEDQAIGIPKGRNPAAVAFASEFVESAKASGAVQKAIDRAGLRGAAAPSGS